MMEIGEQPESSRPREPLGIHIAESCSAADRSVSTAGERDPCETSAYQLQWRTTEKHVLIVEGGRTVCHGGRFSQTVEVQGNPVSIAEIGAVLARRGCPGRGYGRIAMEAAEPLF
jgi:hypothetical protein